MKDFYNIMKAYKAINGLNWGDIGSIIGKSETTIRVAFRRESLSELEKREIVKFYDLEKTGEQQKQKTHLSFDGELEMLQYIVDNSEVFMNLKSFRPFLAKMNSLSNKDTIEKRLEKIEEKLSTLMNE